MKKRVIALLLVAVMALGMFAGCGKAKSNGKVLNIYVWNEEFRSRITDFYPGYQKIDDANGMIGDVKVVWTTVPSDNLAYQNNLDAALEKQADAAADDKIDIFLIEADYALKYVNSDYTMSLKDLGIKDADLAEQYQYTKDICTDSDGKLKGVSWQGCPGVMFYNREFAKEIFGTDDPATIQGYVKDWATYEATAKKVKDAGYWMTSTPNDTYRAYSNNVTSKWVVDGKINIDANIKKWVDDTKKLFDAGYIKGAENLWSADWSSGFYPEGKVFAYFGPAWLVNFCMAAGEAGSVANLGQFGAVSGPQGFYWGGTWICAAEGTDNADLVKDIMLKMTTDKTILKNIVEGADDYANNVTLMKEMASSSYSSKILGGQNPLGMYAAGAENISLSNTCEYDQGCNEKFQEAMKEYFLGNATYDQALDLFYKAIGEVYPSLQK